MRIRTLPLEYAIRNLGRRPLRTVLTGIASTLVAAVLVATTSFVRGLEQSFAGAARADTAILLSAVAERDVVRSTVAQAVTDLVAADVSGVLEIDGVPAVSGEIHMGTNLRLGAQPPPGAADPVFQGFVRGVTDRAFLVHDSVTIVAGRPPGASEVLVGRLVAPKLGIPESAVAPGRTLRFEGGEFVVAGTFAAPGTTIESEIWANVHELKGLTKRDDNSIVFVRMRSPELLPMLDLFAKRRLDLELVAIPTATYYRELADYFTPIQRMAWAMAIMIGAAAMFSGANTLNAAIQDRLKELATLGTMGYPLFALVLSLLAEALVLAASGGLLGLVLARLLVAGSAVRIAMSAFALRVDAASVLVGFAGVLALGVLGTIPAAIRVFRLPIAAALKEP
jgi:putative ABC transport system permease protein